MCNRGVLPVQKPKQQQQQHEKQKQGLRGSRLSKTRFSRETHYSVLLVLCTFGFLFTTFLMMTQFDMLLQSKDHNTVYILEEKVVNHGISTLSTKKKSEKRNIRLNDLMKEEKLIYDLIDKKSLSIIEDLQKKNKALRTEVDAVRKKIEESKEAPRINHLRKEIKTVKMTDKSISISTHDQAENEKSASTTARTDAIPYTGGPLCGGCLTASIDGGIRSCGEQMKKIMNTDKTLTLVEAAAVVVESYPTTCGVVCACNNAPKFYRYDDIAPPTLHEQTHYLSSIPSTHRLPVAALQNHKALITFLNHTQNVYPQRKYLFEYNPSIAKLPKPFAMTTSEDNATTAMAYYLASYRVSTIQSCFPSGISEQMNDGNWKKYKEDYLGLALLRDDLSIIADAMYSLDSDMFDVSQDFRLHSLHDQIYLSSFKFVAPLWIHYAPTVTTSTNTNNNATTMLEHWKHSNHHRELTPLHANKKGDHFVMSRILVGLGSKKTSNNNKDKNLQYFVNAKNETMVQLTPPSVTGVSRINRWNIDTPLPSTHHDNQKIIVNSSQELLIKQDASQVPKNSFATLDEPYYYDHYKMTKLLFSGDRGSACCVRIPHPNNDNDYLLMGVSHFKTPPKKHSHFGVVGNSYLSRFYAFEPLPPYATVAVSGGFCLGAASSSLRQQHNNHKNSTVTAPKNPLASMFAAQSSSSTKSTAIPQNMLVLSGITSATCPKIGFVSGLTEKAKDNTTLILSYGVNDCYPQFVEIRKSDATRILFP